MKKQFKFPSPYGVSFILIKCQGGMSTSAKTRFPSPYGVSFILINSANDVK